MKNILIISIIILILAVIFVIHQGAKTKSPGSDHLIWSEFEKKAQDKNTKVIDIRTFSEVSNGKLFDDALEIDYYTSDFEEKVSKLDPSQTYLIYCYSGSRSQSALSIFNKYNLKAYDLDDGYISVQ